MRFRQANNKAGFTLVEVLLVVGILIALFALSAVALGQYVVDLRQKEMDAKAEIIYFAAQNRLAILRANGNEAKYQTGSDALPLNMIPLDAASDSPLTEESLHYVTSQSAHGDPGSIAAQVLPDGAISYDVWQGHWIIEFEMSSGDVYSVFYSERSLEDYTTQQLQELRIKQYRRSKTRGYVGYYGGEVSSNQSQMDLQPHITIDNQEKLTVTFQCISPDYSPLSFRITIIDRDGNSVEHEPVVTPSGRNYEYVWVLDDLTSPETQFKNTTIQYKKDEQGNYVLDANNSRVIEAQLTDYTYITIRLDVMSDNPMIQPGQWEESTNGLYADDRPEGLDTAVILYGRHLQNLDTATSGGRPVRAVQKRDISFLYDSGVQNNWYSVYGNKTFAPIYSQALTAYNGSYENISGQRVQTVIHGLTTDVTENGGLFRLLQGGTYENICVVAPQISATGYAGGLAGCVAGNVTISGCGVFLDETRGDLKDRDETSIWLSAPVSGGLVGKVDANAQVRIQDCFAAISLEGSEQAAGLVGSHQGSSLQIAQSYADCYLYGDTLAGLATAQEALTIESCYAVGYQTPGTTGAGLVSGAGTATISNCYSGVYYYETSNKTIYPIAQSADSADTYYLQLSGLQEPDDGQTAKSFTQLSARSAMVEFLGDAFTATTAGTRPYKLAGQGLTEYDYPWLKNMPHYGDWQTQFRTGSLCYYEDYGEDVYGFYGGGIDALQSSGYVLGDGYGVVYMEPVTEDIVYDDEKILSKDTYYTVVSEGIDYYVYPLPVEDMIQAPAANQFYTKITIHNSEQIATYYYNPHFAWCISSSQSSQAPDILRIRSARQLNLLSRYYVEYYRDVTANTTFLQEMDICYADSDDAYLWKDYGYENAVTEQAPIGSMDAPFQTTYDGGNHYIYNLNIRDEAKAVGLFGAVAAEVGQLRNIVMIHDYNGTTGVGGKINYAGGIMTPGQHVSIGALAGYNGGTITNCAVSGYNTQLNVYYGSIVYLGGLVGTNAAGGMVTNSSVVTIGTSLNVNNSEAYVGGFVGMNAGHINRCYALGAYRVEASKSSTTIMAGFAGMNNMGTVLRSYCAVSLVAAGSAESVAFAPRGGLVGATCRYLNNGTYELASELYAFQAEEANSDGNSVDFVTLLTEMEGFSPAAEAKMHPNTTGSYPFPAVVSDGTQVVHYGDWVLQVSMGDMGLFYWEEESGGSNDGVHISYLGTDGTYGSNLCTSHEDGGSVVSFGYGYYYKDGIAAPAVSFGSKNASAFTLNNKINQALTEQMPGYTFYAFDSGKEEGQLKPEGSNANLNCTIGGHSFVISPFFADAMSKANAIAYDGKDYAKTPGTSENPYGIRAPMQLQYINWNSEKGSYDYTIYESQPTAAKQFTYLRFVWGQAGDTQSADAGTGYNHYWVQSHDLDFSEGVDGNGKTFTPIGSLHDVGTGTGSNATIAYFAGSYNGKDYTIRNVSISSRGACIGLFGVTLQAKLEKIALYSDQNSIIQNEKEGNSWYCIGGLVGFAGKGTNERIDSVISNCAVAGYQIIDQRKDTEAYGGTNIGGLVGATNMEITGCSAVVDIIIALDYIGSGRNIRVGGIAGSCPSTITNCYAGGSVVSNVDGTGKELNIWVGGLVGGSFIRSTGTIQQVFGTVTVATTVKNCYSYVQLPEVNLAGNRINSVQALVNDGDNTSDGRGIPQVYNSYCLESAVQNAGDYQNRSNVNNWLDANPTGTGETGAVHYVNDRAPFLTYEEMSNGTLLGYLGSAFGTITVTENGSPIPGKYSFPCGSTSLASRDYPFPTILTQDNRFGMDENEPDKVNVHYGVWPKDGLYWELYETEMDILIADTQTVNITTWGDSGVNLTADSFVYTTKDYADPKAQVISKEDAPVRVTAVTKNSDGSWTVTLTAWDEGTVYITPSADTAKNSLFVTVTAEVVVRADPNPAILLLGGNDLSVTLSATNNAETPALLSGSSFRWTVTDLAESNIAQLPISDIVKDKAGQVTQSVTLSSIRQGETFFQVTVTYQLDDQREYTGTGLVHVQVVDGYVGISDHSQYNEANLSTQTTGVDKEYTQLQPDLKDAELFLYTNLDAGEFALTGVTATDAEGNPVTVNSWSLGSVTRDGNGYYYRPLLVDALSEGPINLTAVVKYGKTSCTLSLRNVTLAQYHTVTVNHNDDAGTVTSLYIKDGDALAGYLPALVRQGYRFLGWTPAVDDATTVTGDMTVTAQWQRVYKVTLDANGGTVESTTVEITSVSELPTPKYAVSTMGYEWEHSFLYWEDADGNQITDSYQITEDTTLIARWQYIIVYKNGTNVQYINAKNTFTNIERNSITGIYDHGTALRQNTHYSITKSGRQYNLTINDNVDFTALVIIIS